MFLTNVLGLPCLRLSSVLIVGLFMLTGVYGDIMCGDNIFTHTECDDDEYCCGLYNNQCCKIFNDDNKVVAELVAVLMFLVVFVCCPYMCYRCCCARTTSRGVVYAPAGTTTTTAVTVGMPGQLSQQVPYPTVVPYPQQTPYPPQHATNPYFNLPPPDYNQATQAGPQYMGPAPNAPYFQS